MLIPFLLKKLRSSGGAGRPAVYLPQFLIAEMIGLARNETHLEALSGFAEVLPFTARIVNSSALIARASVVTTPRYLAHREDDEWLMAA